MKSHNCLQIMAYLTEVHLPPFCAIFSNTIYNLKFYTFSMNSNL